MTRRAPGHPAQRLTQITGPETKRTINIALANVAFWPIEMSRE